MNNKYTTRELEKMAMECKKMLVKGGWDTKRKKKRNWCDKETELIKRNIRYHMCDLIIYSQMKDINKIVVDSYEYQNLIN